MKAIQSIEGKGLFLKGANIDTDQIIPARFLKCTTFTELAAGLFYDQRFKDDGSPLNHPLNEYEDSSILFTESNFGCGSSREHAPQALQKFGVKAIVGISFGPIFQTNCFQIGLPCFSIDAEQLKELAELVMSSPTRDVKINVKDLVLECAGESFKIQTTSGNQKSLLEGTYDPLAQLLAHKEKILALDAATEKV